MEFEKKIVENFLDTEDYKLMKNNIWLKRVCFPGEAYFVLKYKPKPLFGECLLSKEFSSKKLGEILRYIKENAGFGVDHCQLKDVMEIETNRFVTKGNLTVDASLIGEKYYFTMTSSLFCKGKAEEDMIYATSRLTSKISSEYKKEIFPTISKATMYLLTQKKDLFNSLKETIGLSEPPEIVFKEDFKDELPKKSFVIPDIDYDCSQEDFLLKIGLKDGVVTESELVEY